MPRGTAEDAVKFVDAARALGFNAMVVSGGRPDFRGKLFDYARQQGVKVYLTLNAIYGEWGFQKAEGVAMPSVDCLQSYDNLKDLNTPRDTDDVSYPGPWLCPDRPEVRKYAADLAASLMKDKPDGIAVDFVGYKNQSGCRCEYSRARRAEFVKAHPELDAKAAECRFSLESLAALYEEVRKAVVAMDKEAKLAAHVYPPFTPEPLYGNRLPVEYPAQTVAWFFAPHWPMEKVVSRCRAVKADEKQSHDYVTGTGFIGLNMDEVNAKSAERLRAEIRAIRSAGLKAIMVAGTYGDFLKEAPAKVFAEELGGKPAVAGTGAL